MNKPLGNGDFTRAFAGERDDDTVIPRFYIEAEPVTVDGIETWRDVEMVEHIIPGHGTRHHAIVQDKHRNRWPKQYAAFKANLEAPIDGIPLGEWPVLKPSQVLKLKSIGFRTVENIANMDDIACQNIGLGGMQLRLKAKAYLDEAAQMAITNKAIEDAAKWEALANDLRAQVERTNEAMAQMQRDMAAMQMSQHLHMQNLAATPQVQVQAYQAPAAPRSDAMFSDFAATPRSRIRGELKALSDAGATGRGVQMPPRPQMETVNIEPPLPKKRGRKSNAEKAAMAAAEAGAANG